MKDRSDRCFLDRSGMAIPFKQLQSFFLFLHNYRYGDSYRKLLLLSVSLVIYCVSLKKLLFVFLRYFYVKFIGHKLNYLPHLRIF